MAEEFVSQGQVNGTSPAEVVVNYLKAQSGKFVFDGFLNGVTPTMTIQRGSTYRFDLTGASGHALAFSTDSGNSSAYTTNVTTSAGITQLIVAANAPATLYYYCSNHAGMGGTMNVVDAPVAWGADSGKSYQVDVDCTGATTPAANGTISPESLATAQGSVTINNAAGYGRIEKGNMRWGLMLEVLSERENPNYVTWAGVDANSARDGSNTGNFTKVRFTVNYPTNFTPTTYLDSSGAVTSTLIDAPDDAIEYVIGKVLSNIITHNRSLGADDPGLDQKDHNSVTAPAMFANFGAAVAKVTVTSL